VLVMGKLSPDPSSHSSSILPTTLYGPGCKDVAAGGDAFDGCDRTTSKMRGLSPKIISGDSRRSENAQTHTQISIQYQI
jgi:hypothetical protein